jgi:hypothetical protein
MKAQAHGHAATAHRCHPHPPEHQRATDTPTHPRFHSANAFHLPFSPAQCKQDSTSFYRSPLNNRHPYKSGRWKSHIRPSNPPWLGSQLLPAPPVPSPPPHDLLGWRCTAGSRRSSSPSSHKHTSQTNTHIPLHHHCALIAFAIGIRTDHEDEVGA